MRPRLHVLVPFWGVAGGVIKVLDYAEHGLHAGFDVTLWGPGEPSTQSTLSTLPVFVRLREAKVDRRDLAAFGDLVVGEQDRVLFTEPGHASFVDELGVSGGRVIHLVQGTRHATPTFNDGLHYRILHRRFVRIAVTGQVHEAIAPHVHPAFPLHLVVEGHDIDFFAGDRYFDRSAGPVRVLYNTWKSDLGDRVAATVDDPSIVFTAIRDETSWSQLRDLYLNADIFIGAPGPEEGFYLPGLEALAARCALVMSLVGGNRAYGEPGINMVSCPFDDAAHHGETITELAKDTARRAELTAAGVVTAQRFRIQRERAEVVKILLDPLGNYDESRPITP